MPLDVLGDLEKQPNEVFPVTVDFAAELSLDSDTISTKTVTAIDLADGSDAGALLSGSPSHSGSKVTQVVTGGTDGKQYKLTYQIVTAAGRTWEAEVKLWVQEV